MTRRGLLLLPLLLASCTGEPQATRTFAPISYGYLTPLRLNVGAVEVADEPAGFGHHERSFYPKTPAVRRRPEKPATAPTVLFASVK